MRGNRKLVTFLGMVIFMGASGFGQDQQAVNEPAAARNGSEAKAPEPETTQAPASAEPSFFRNLKFSGLVDVYATYNFNRPASRTNALHNFDFNSGQFSLNLAEFVIEQPADPVGFRVDIGFGDTMDWIHGADPSTSQTLRHLQQVYMTFKPPSTKNFVIDVGKFVTQHGAEVIETRDNWNYSRSLLFAWAIPYYHFGARARYNFTDTTFLGLHLVNGWNNVLDNNSGKTVGFQLGFSPAKGVSLLQNYMVGTEQPGPNAPRRHLLDTTVTVQANDRLWFLFNYDYGRDELQGDSVYWTGVAGYVRYALTPRLALITRGEWFSDPDGFSTGTAQRLKEVTATLEAQIHEHMVGRFEYRVDWSDKSVFEVRDRLGDSRFQNGLIGGLFVFF